MKGLFTALMGGMIDLLATLTQIVCIPVNATLTALLPDISDFILDTTTTINTAFSNMTWALSFLKLPLISVLTLILTIEIAKVTIYLSVNPLIRTWTLFKKIKFW